MLCAQDKKATAEKIQKFLTQAPQNCLTDRTELGNTALHFAALHRRKRVALILLEKQANPLAENMKGETPVHWCCQNGTPSIVKALIRGINDLDDVLDKGGNTPLHWAAETGNLPVVQLLLNQGASPIPRNYQWETPSEHCDDEITLQCLADAAASFTF